METAQEKLSDAYFKSPVVLGCKCLHLCKPLAKSVNTSPANDDLGEFELKGCLPGVGRELDPQTQGGKRI